MLQVVTTGAYYPPVVTAGRFLLQEHPTGSFRKKGKSKTVFMGTKFHEKLIFSAFFSRELATNLRS